MILNLLILKSLHRNISSLHSVVLLIPFEKNTSDLIGNSISSFGFGLVPFISTLPLSSQRRISEFDA